MIITSPVPSGSPSIPGYESGNTIIVRASDTSPAARNMWGFIEPDLSPDSEFSYLFDISFRINPVNWQVQIQTPGIANRLTTWGGRLVGDLNQANQIIVQQSNGAAAVHDHRIRLLIPRLASPSSVAIVLGSAERAGLLAVRFTRCFAAMHPCPKLTGDLKLKKRTKNTASGRKVVVWESTNKIFGVGMSSNSWGTNAQLSDIDQLETITSMGVWPSGLDTAFSAASDVRWRRPAFVRNCAVSEYSGLSGYDGLDAGPIQVRLRFDEIPAA